MIHFRLMKGNDFYEKNNWHETVFRAFIPDHAGGHGSGNGICGRNGVYRRSSK